MNKFRSNLGIDPTKEEWRKICRVIQEKKLLPFFDCAYQGFATGDLVSKLLLTWIKICKMKKKTFYLKKVVLIKVIMFYQFKQYP